MDTESVWKNAWNALENASSNKNDEFNTAVIGSYDEIFGADLRTVVLRNALSHRQELWFYTDNRSDKMQQLILNHKISWLFWSRHEKIQLRFYGDVEICNQTEETREIWSDLSFRSRLAYLAEPGPGTSVPNPDDGLQNAGNNSETSEKGYAHFTLVKTTVTKLDWLQLAGEGHRRICYQRNGNKWLSHWLIP